jgi:hypothetical protein
MNTLWTPLNIAQPSNNGNRLNVLRACSLTLASLLVLPAFAQQASTIKIKDLGVPQINIVGPGAGPLPLDGPVLGQQKAAVQGAGPTPPTIGARTLAAAPVPPPSPTARTMAPSSPTPVSGPTQPTAVTTNSIPSAPTSAVSPVPPMQGNPVADMQLVSPKQSNPGIFASLSPNSAPQASSIVEIFPGLQKLSESMRELPTLRQQGIESNPLAAASNDKCVSVNLRPDTQRPGLNLVDLTGDGLIVSAVPDAHIQSVFAKAGYGQVDLSQTARWCITQTAARALVRPSSGVGTQQAALLVQTGTSLQLMSQDQWLAHQASVKPLVAAMATSSKPIKPSKPAYKLVAKRSSKPTTGVAVSALRLPAASSKLDVGA